MPTIVHFVGAGESVTLADEYQEVSSQLGNPAGGQFTLANSGRLVTIYKSAVAYIEDKPSDEGPMVA